MIANDLLKIQNGMDSPGEHPRAHLADDEPRNDEAADDQKDWVGVPLNYSPYHPGYTTSHWLMVYRAV